MRHDDDHGDEGSPPYSAPSRRGSGDEHRATQASDEEQGTADERGGDHAGSGANDQEIAEVEREIEAAEEALEGQIVAPPGGGPRRTRISWSGPLPPASELAAYNEVDPTFAERIMRCHERLYEIAEQREATVARTVDSQIDIQQKLAAADIRYSGRGQLMLYSIAVLALAGALVLAHWGMGIAAVASIVVSVLSVSANLINAARNHGGQQDEGDTENESNSSDE